MIAVDREQIRSRLVSTALVEVSGHRQRDARDTLVTTTATFSLFLGALGAFLGWSAEFGLWTCAAGGAAVGTAVGLLYGRMVADRTSKAYSRLGYTLDPEAVAAAGGHVLAARELRSKHRKMTPRELMVTSLVIAVQNEEHYRNSDCA